MKNLENYLKRKSSLIMAGILLGLGISKLIINFKEDAAITMALLFMVILHYISTTNTPRTEP